MSYSPGVYRSAGVLVKRYGEDAVAYARMRADHLLEDGHVMGSVMWRAIMGAVRELLSQRSPKNDPAR